MNFQNRKPLMVFGMFLVLGVMIGAMITLAVMLEAPSISVLGMGSIMALPFIGLVVMLAFMFIFFRKMTGGDFMSRMIGQTQKPQSIKKDRASTDLTLTIPGINCGHCKMKIEQVVGKLPGVMSIHVDVDTRRAAITFRSPTTEFEIRELLDEIGYPPVVSVVEL